MTLHQVKPISIGRDNDPDDGIGTFLFEPDPNWTPVANGDPLWDPDLERIQPRLKHPPQSEQLRQAVVSRDLAAVQRVFTSQWLEKAEAERINIGYYTSSLDEAIHQNDVPIASYLLSNGVPMYIYHFTKAAETKKYALLQLFLDMGWDINEPIERTKPPPLSLVLNDANLTSWFLARGADPNAECGLDLTPLSVAVCNAPFEIIQLLFDHGGSIKHGQLLHYAVRRDSIDRLQVLQFIIDKGPPINHVMYQDRLDCYDQLMFFGIGTPLHEAAERGKLDMVEFLLARGADPLIRDARRKLAIDRARRAGQDAVVELLLPLHSDPASQPCHDFTATRHV